MKGLTTVFTHRGLAPHQFTPMSGAHHRAALDAGSAFCYTSDVSGPARVSAGRSAAEARLMRLHRIVCFVAASLALLRNVAGQGFLNLDFEDATIEPTPVGGGIFPADPLQALPGWTVGGPNTTVSYNRESIGGPMVSLMGPDFPNYAGFTPLQGSYSVLLYYFSAYGAPTLSQTARVPSFSQSINFLVGSGMGDAVVTMNGVNIPLIPIAGGRLAGNVSAFAGSVAQLTFSTPDIGGYPGQLLYLDDIQFSTSVVPEPKVHTLLAFSILFLLCFLTVRRHRAP